MDSIKKSRHQKKRRTKKIKATGQSTESPGLDSPLLDEDDDEELMLESEPIEEEKAGEGEEGELSEDDALLQVVDSLWDQYDDDGNGCLDMDETRKFILNIMSQVPNAAEF
jgi:hypothetical protein